MRIFQSLRSRIAQGKISLPDDEQLQLELARIRTNFRAQRSRVEILTSYFGETGAVNVLGRKLRLPRSIGLHNQYGLWGPGDARGELMIVVHAPEAELDAWFTTCERRASIDCPYCMELLQAEAVYLCRNARRPLRDLWPQMRMYE